MHHESQLKPDVARTQPEEGLSTAATLRRAVGDEIEFISIILWNSLDDVRAIAAPDYDKTIISEDRLPLLSRHDAGAEHYALIATGEPPVAN